MTQKCRYATLDVMRGIAALAVVGFHIGQTRLEDPIVSHGYLAVDFFFVLSGFVVALAYEGALRNGLTWRAFVVKRIIRLYPLAMLGAAAGLIVLLAKFYASPQKVDSLGQIGLSGLFNVFLLPTLFGGAASRYDLFPGNGPLWSLFFEMLVNIAWVLWAARLRTGIIAIVTALSFAGLVVATNHYGFMNVGFNVQTIGGGFARVCFGFSFGVLIYRLHAICRLPALPLGSTLLAVCLVVVLVRPSIFGTTHDLFYDLVCVGIVLPAIVATGLYQTTDDRVASWLGDLSYPLYVLHFPILALASGLRQSHLAAISPHGLTAAAVVVILIIANLALHGFDEPLRRLLGGLVKRRAWRFDSLAQRPSSETYADQVTLQRQAAK